MGERSVRLVKDETGLVSVVINDGNKITEIRRQSANAYAKLESEAPKNDQHSLTQVPPELGYQSFGELVKPDNNKPSLTPVTPSMGGAFLSNSIPQELAAGKTLTVEKALDFQSDYKLDGSYKYFVGDAAISEKEFSKDVLNLQLRNLKLNDIKTMNNELNAGQKDKGLELLKSVGDDVRKQIIEMEKNGITTSEYETFKQIAKKAIEATGDGKSAGK